MTSAWTVLAALVSALVEDCPAVLRPLAELQYRGVLWTQKNARDCKALGD